jgi:hypothetical protein
MINFLKGQEDWTLRLTEYPKILGTSTYYTNNMNKLGSDRTSQGEIANTILKKLKGKKIPFPFDIFVNDSNIDNFPKDRLFSIYSFFICYMNEPMIKKFGQPLYHSEFGEGFDDKKLKKYLYASYFIEVGGVEMHIGWDNRGSSVEVDESKSPQEICEALIELANYIL